MAKFFRPDITVDYWSHLANEFTDPPTFSNVPATYLKPWHALGSSNWNGTAINDLIHRFLLDASIMANYSFSENDHLLMVQGGRRWYFIVYEYAPFTFNSEGQVTSFYVFCKRFYDPAPL